MDYKVLSWLFINCRVVSLILGSGCMSGCQWARYYSSNGINKRLGKLCNAPKHHGRYHR